MNLLKIEIDHEPTPLFNANEKAFNEKWPIICNEGGARSSKTYSVIQLLCQIAAVDKPGVRISIVSHSLPHIKKGAYRDFAKIMKDWHLWDDANFSFTDFVYNFPNGSYIELLGLEDESKARGPGRDILFINEANLISKTLFDQLAMRTTGQIFLDWNPADFSNWVYEVADNKKNKRIHSTYLNNRSNLSQTQIDLIESYRDLPDDFLWKVYGLGERGAAKEMIYTQWKLIDRLPGKGDVFYGLDFGYVHPAALVKIEHYEGTNYVQEIIYESGLTLSDLVKKMQGAGIDKHSPIYADAAEPKSIEEIFRAGFNIYQADKDVWAGIVKVKSYPLFITSDSANLKTEIQGYKWRKDKDDNILEEPVKTKDDACFVGSTLINCEGGLKQIKDVRKGDKVLTSSGFKTVDNIFNNGCNKICEYVITLRKFDIVIKCTPNHLIKTNDGWKAILNLQSGQRVSLPKSLIAKDLLNMQAQGIIRMGPLSYTAMCGSFIMDQYRTGTTFTTKMKMLTITIVQTLNYLLRINTFRGILKRDCRIIRNGLKSFKEWVLHQHLNGTNQQRVPSGTSSTRKKIILENLITLKKAVNVVKNNTSQQPCTVDFAQTNASRSIGEIQGRILLLESAPDAKPLSKLIDLLKQNFVEDHVVLQIVGKDAGMQNVYDVEVAEVHEYFANGLLVHNCDALRYGIFTHLTKLQITFIRL